ncbi:DinB family protein [Sphingobacterium faecale]|uniref:Damage-inducible protein DinB n=1 Tax=Sphingobacterium faecale TaxID=2803775 RepID=A0ABS1R546_9SPHI|nr:DinB family protein [Sphingobacterium faecale]MBL1409359.1 damage-inducible protein DinB [Sphingobacterium faecale]
MNTQGIISKEELLKSWQGHRALARRVIEKFPEKELFEFSIGGMRPFAEMVKEMLSIAVPGLESIVSNQIEKYDHNLPLTTKQELLEHWDADTPKIDALFSEIAVDRFKESFKIFGEYEFPIVENIQYFIDNEIHHRAQGYVYLRALGIEPPFFWERY